jgi:hypothetical protein
LILHKLFREGKTDTPEYKELEDELEIYFKDESKPVERKKKTMRCKCSK